MPNFTNKKAAYILLGVFIVLGFALRLISAWNAANFWFDEIVTVSVAAKPLSQMLPYLAYENNPPLFTLLVHWWLLIFGQSEVIVKLLSVIIGTLSIVVIYLLAEQMFSRLAALFASFLMSVSSFQVFYSQEARMYPLLLLLSGLSYYFFWRLLFSQKRYWWWVYAAVTLAVLYTHLTGLVVPVSQFLFLVYLQYKKRLPNSWRWRSWRYYASLLFLAYLPWLVTFIYTKLQTFNRGAWYFYVDPLPLFFLEVSKQFIIFANDLPFIEWLTVVLMAILVMASFMWWQRLSRGRFQVNVSFPPPVVLSFIILFLPLILGFALNVNVVKYYIVAALGLYLLAGFGFERFYLAFKKSSLGIEPVSNQERFNSFDRKVLLFFISIFFLILPANIAVMTQVSPSWDEAARFIEANEQPGDKAIIASFSFELPLRYYYRGQIELQGFYPFQDGDDLLLRVIKRNWYSVIDKDNVNQLAQLTAGYRRIFLVASAKVFINSEDFVKKWFFRHGWRLVKHVSYQGFADPEVFLLERTSN